MKEKRELVHYLVTAALGLGVWLVISIVTHKVEAWDSPYYFKLGLPLLMFFSSVSGFIDPRRAWRWGVVVIILQPVALFVQNPVGNLLLLGLILFGFLMIPCIFWTAPLGLDGLG